MPDHYVLRLMRGCIVFHVSTVALANPTGAIVYVRRWVRVPAHRRGRSGSPGAAASRGPIRPVTLLIRTLRRDPGAAAPRVLFPIGKRSDKKVGRSSTGDVAAWLNERHALRHEILDRRHAGENAIPEAVVTM